jgi:RimJ/RimL family protein N-acetyltransferase
MRLEGQRCVIRAWRTGDADAIVRHANNANVASQLRDRFPHPYTRHHALQFLQMVTSDPSETNLAIEVGGQVVGGVGFVPGNDVERFSAEIGYWLGETMWGRGIATETVVLLTAYTFDELNLLRVFALPFADNVASRRVLEKAGYECEAILRASSVKAGRPRDQALYARINPKWRGI